MSGIIHSVKYQKDIKLPLDNGRYFTDEMWLNPGKTAFTVAFYDQDDNLVTPESGTVISHLSPIADQFHQPGSGDLIVDANKCGEFASYQIPYFEGPAHRGSVIFTDIVAPIGTYALCQFWRS